MEQVCMNYIDKAIDEGLDFDAYIQVVREMVLHESTSGEDKSLGKVNLTKVNFKRMQRLSKLIQLPLELHDKIIQLKKPQTWILIAESWCADGAQILPAIHKITEATYGKIQLKIVFRDENPDLMEAYLTEGGRAIPKLIALDENWNEKFVWGPRPKGAKAIMAEWKVNPNGRSKDQVLYELHDWYNSNKCLEIFEEVIELAIN